MITPHTKTDRRNRVHDQPQMEECFYFPSLPFLYLSTPPVRFPLPPLPYLFPFLPLPLEVLPLKPARGCGGAL